MKKDELDAMTGSLDTFIKVNSVADEPQPAKPAALLAEEPKTDEKVPAQPSRQKKARKQDRDSSQPSPIKFAPARERKSEKMLLLLTPSIRRRLRAAASETGLSMNDYVNQLLDQFLPPNATH